MPEGDKRAFMEKLASKTKMAAAKKQLSLVYKFTKQLSGQGNICTKLVKEIASPARNCIGTGHIFLLRLRRLCSVMS